MQAQTLLERWFAAGDAGDFDVFDEVLDPRVLIHAPMGLSGEGPEAEKQVWRDARSAMPDLRHELQDVVTDGALIAARAIVTGTLERDFASIEGTGQRFRIDQALFARVADGKIVEAWEIIDSAALLRQLGAIDDPSG